MINIEHRIMQDMTTIIAAGTTTTPETGSATGIGIARDTVITDEDVITEVANGRGTATGREV